MEDRKVDRRCAAPRTERRLAASIAHEINNPLDSLLSLLHLIEAEATLTEKGHEYLTLAQEEVHRVSKIAHQTLYKCRHEAAPEYANVPQLLDDVVTLYKPRLESRGIMVKTRYCPDGRVPVYPRQLRQIFSNLLLNAADAMPNSPWCKELNFGTTIGVLGFVSSPSISHGTSRFGFCTADSDLSGVGAGNTPAKEAIRSGFSTPAAYPPPSTGAGSGSG